MSNNQLSKGENGAAITVAVGCLLVSITQAASYLWSFASTPVQQFWLCGTVVFLLTGSQIIARLAGRNIAAGNSSVAGLCLLSVLVLECFSVATSIQSLDGRVVSVIREQNLASPEYSRALQKVSNYQTQIQSLQKSIDKMPDNFITKREGARREMMALQTRLDRAHRDADNIDVSVIGKSMQNITDSVGVTPTNIAAVAAISLSFVPLIINIASGALIRREKIAVKKQKTKLRAVS